MFIYIGKTSIFLIYGPRAFGPPSLNQGIAIWCMFAKLFESTVNSRLWFLNEAFDTKDVFNDGFQNGSRTTDKIFVLNSSIQRQLSLGNTLYLHLRKAFDLVSRRALFYKIIKWHGNVVDRLWSLCKKTYFRVKCKGKLSRPIIDNVSVYENGIASGPLIRKAMYNLSERLRNVNIYP